MPQEPQNLLDAALQLPIAERGQLVARLIQSFEGEDDLQVEEAWSSELRRRLEEIDEGRVQMIPWSVARLHIRGENETSAD